MIFIPDIGWFIPLDSMVNGVTVYLMFKFAEKPYLFLCKPLVLLCYCCFGGITAANEAVKDKRYLEENTSKGSSKTLDSKSTHTRKQRKHNKHKQTSINDKQKHKHNDNINNDKTSERKDNLDLGNNTSNNTSFNSDQAETDTELDASTDGYSSKDETQVTQTRTQTQIQSQTLSQTRASPTEAHKYTVNQIFVPSINQSQLQYQLEQPGKSILMLKSASSAE